MVMETEDREAEMAPDPLIDDEEVLNEQELAAGGAYRETPKREMYWLDLDHLREYERMNASIETDEDFWAWFDAFRKTAELKPVKKERKERRDRGATSWASHDWGWKGSNNNKDYLHEMWTGWGYSAATSDLSRKLAIALGAISTTVQAVRTKAGRYRVRLADKDTISAPTSFTSFEDELIVVSPQPLLDPQLEETKAIEITTAWALHEAGHSEHTVDVYPQILKPYVLRPAAVAALICNILEDVRVERLIGEDFPGFQSYFALHLEYLWKTTGKDESGNEIPREGHWATQDLNSKLNWVIRAIRWPDEFRPIVEKAVSDGTDVDALTEFEWWREWLREYNEGAVAMRESVIEALARLAADPETEKEMRAQSELEQKMESDGGLGLQGMGEEAAKDLLRRMIEKMQEGKGTIVGACPSPMSGKGEAMAKGKQHTPKTKIDGKVAGEVEKLIEEELEIDVPPPWFQDAWEHPAARQIQIKRPIETPASKQVAKAHDRSRDPLMQRLRGAFVFRPVAAEWSTRLQRTGSIDDEELWRAPTGDYRVFEQKTVESKPDTDITLLVDMSGSMNSYNSRDYTTYTAGTKDHVSKIELAARLAQLAFLCIRTTHGVSLRVRGHTGDNGDAAKGTPCVYKIWDQGDPISRLGLIETIGRGNNYDGFAIGWCAEELLNLGRGGNQKLLIVFSDGIPHGQGYSGDPAQNHVHDVFRNARQKGVTIVQVAVGMFSEEAQQAMYEKNYIVYEDDATLPNNLQKLLAKFI